MLDVATGSDNREVSDVGFGSRASRRTSIRVRLLVSDAVALFAATQLASLLRFGGILHLVVAPGIPRWFNIIDLSLIMTALWIVILAFEGLYDPQRVFWGTGEYRRVVRALSLGIIAVILLEYVLKLPGLSRGWVLLSLTLGCAFVVAGRAVVRLLIASGRRAGKLMRPTLIVGFNREAGDIVKALRKDTSSGLVPVGYLASSRNVMPSQEYRQEQDFPCLGYAGEIRRVLSERFIDTVLVSTTAFEHEVIARVINDLRDCDVDIQLSSGLFDVTTSRVMIREVSGVPLVTIRSVSFAPWKRAVKRAFDLVVAATIVLAGTPLWVVVAIGIRLTSAGPVFFTQTRTGRDGRPFEMLKFRSMRTDAAELHAHLSAEANEADGPIFKMKNDPRVTSLGRLMRKYSIDELPQLINVLRGEMSLVGPRPLPVYETKALTPLQRRRHEVPPGLTGLWQVSGRSNLSFDEMIHLDLFYIENWSVASDLVLLGKTVPAVLLPRGAY